MYTHFKILVPLTPIRKRKAALLAASEKEEEREGHLTHCAPTRETKTEVAKLKFDHLFVPRHIPRSENYRGWLMHRKFVETHKSQVCQVLLKKTSRCVLNNNVRMESIHRYILRRNM